MTSIAGERHRRALAVCVEGPAGVWLGYRGETRDEAAAREVAAVAMCAGCPVRQACLDEALTWPIDAQGGVRGGMTAAARRAELRARRREGRARVERLRRDLSLAMLATVADVTDPESYSDMLAGAA